MSLTLTVFLSRELVPGKEEFERAIIALGFSVQIDTSYVPFRSSGFLPCVVGGRKSGFEISFEDSQAALEQLKQIKDAVGARDAAIVFRWGGDMAECASALIVSAALASAFDAVVYSSDDDILCSASELAEEAKSALLMLEKP
jgi:hypothetical protein